MNKRFMQKEVKFKGASGFMVECSFVFYSHNSGNFHSNEKNKIPESKLESRLSKTKNNFRNQTKDFPLLLIICRTF